jgi:hypothetical protein
MKREIATLNVEIESDSPAARQRLLDGLRASLEADPARVSFPDCGVAQVRTVRVSRVRSKGKR